MRSSSFTGWRRVLALVAATVAVAALAGCGGSSSSSGDSSSGGGSVNTKPASGTIDVWLAGLFAAATPGIDVPQVARRGSSALEKAYPGSKVKFVLTPINNAQFTAQIAAAFASRKVPDVMLVYSGGYTTPYMLSSLQKLNDQVAQTPGFYGEPDSVGSVLPQPRLQGRQGRHLRRPERLRHLRAVLQQGAVQEGRDRGAAEDVQGAARRSAPSSRRRASSRSPTATVTATRPTTG